YPKSTSVKGFQHGSVSLSLRVTQIYGFNQLIYLRRGKCIRKFPAEFWRFDEFQGIICAITFKNQIIEKSTQPGNHTGLRAYVQLFSNFMDKSLKVFFFNGNRRDFHFMVFQKIDEFEHIKSIVFDGII